MSLHCHLLLLFLCRVFQFCYAAASAPVFYPPMTHQWHGWHPVLTEHRPFTNYACCRLQSICKPSDPETPAEVGLHTITVWYSCMGAIVQVIMSAYTVIMAITIKANFPDS
ncbi:hypothetical protein EDD85DRAFT_797435 [Armillaria nabsnona]|nr:hypothetical protein EDD85DRAFT_797435 [Armillaria nabsnona]